MDSTTPIAKNHIRISRALFREGIRAVEDPAYRNSVKKIAVFLLMILLIAAVWLLYTGGSLLFLLGEAIFLGALLFWLIVMLPNTRQNRKYKALTHGTNEIPERTTDFYQNHLTVTANDGQKTTISYSDILSWQETKNLYLIHCRNKVSILLDKNNFVTGDFDRIKKAIMTR